MGSLAMFALGALGALVLVAGVAFVLMMPSHRDDVFCRCCRQELHRPGGNYVHLVGHGFCHDCQKELLTEQ